MTTDSQDHIHTLQRRADALAADVRRKDEAHLKHAACSRELERIHQALEEAQGNELISKQG